MTRKNIRAADIEDRAVLRQQNIPSHVSDLAPIHSDL